MHNNAVLTTIKTTIHSFLPDARVLLFGSQARGDFHKNSDFDVLVITKDPIPPKEKMDMESKISKSLVYSLHMPFDILLHSQGEVNLKKQAKGFIIYHALKDAIEL